MSNKDLVQDAIKGIEASAEAEKRKRELLDKKVIVDSYRVDSDLERIKQDQRDIDAMKSADFSTMGDLAIQRIRDTNKEYIEGAKNCRLFINESFNGYVPFWKGNYIVIGARSKDGKSTAVANIAYSTILTKDPVTGKTGKVLVITNEEEQSSVYNRVTCIHKKWNYVNHERFTEEQVKTMDEYFSVWGKNGRLVVVSDNFTDSNGVEHRGMTTSIEGIQSVLDNIINNKIHYDAIIIDYSQKVNKSKKNPWRKPHEVQADFSIMIDNYKKLLPCPIVVMTQLMPAGKQEQQEFQERIRGTKDLFFHCTAALEMIPDRNSLLTKWTLHANRWNGAVQGAIIVTGYDDGKFVVNDNAFQAKANTVILQRQNKEMSQTTLGKIFEENERDKGKQ